MFDQPHLQDNVLNIVDEPGNNLVESMDEILFGKNFGIISDIEFGPDGALYVISLSEGTIYKIISNVR
jgi:glucose/arabinose dehydrogenase